MGVVFVNFFSHSLRGQASLEFILVLVFMLVIMAAIIVPLGQRSQYALEDVSKAGFVSSAISRIDNTITSMTIIPGSSRQLVDIYLPKGVSFVCNPAGTDNNVGIIFPLNSPVFDSTGNVPPDCVDNSPSPMLCTKYFVFPSYVDLHCQGDSAQGYRVDTGQVGFSQQFRITGRQTTPPLSYIIDFNAV